MSAEPTLAEIMRLALESRLSDVHVALPGRIETYDASTQTADVLPLVRRAIEDEAGGVQHEALPVVPNVPIMFPRSAAFSGSWPMASGDTVLLVFCSSAIGHWQSSGELSDPGDLRRHDLSHAVAYPGLAASGTTIPTASNAAVIEVNAPATHVQIGAAASDFVAMNAKVLSELSSLALALNTHTHPTAPPGVVSVPTGAPIYTTPADVAATKLKSE